MRAARFLTLVALALCLCGMASADPAGTAINVGPGTPNWQWDQGAWTDPDGDGVAQMDLTIQWGRGTGTWRTGGDETFRFWGYKDSDPIVSETIMNFTEDLWKDWHIYVVNGNVSVATIGKTQPNAAPWIVAVQNSLHNSTIVAVVPDPLNPALAIGFGEVLSVYFEFTPIDPSLPVYIDEWPTTDATIPEPGSLVTLATGLAALALGVRRRVR